MTFNLRITIFYLDKKEYSTSTHVVSFMLVKNCFNSLSLEDTHEKWVKNLGVT